MPWDKAGGFMGGLELRQEGEVVTVITGTGSGGRYGELRVIAQTLLRPTEQQEC